MNTALVPGTASLVSCNATAAGAVALTSDAVMATPSGDERNAFVDSPSTPPSPASVPLLPPSSLFYGTNLASPSLRRLEKIADALLAGSWNSMDHFRAICETEGYPCDMAVVLEARAARSMMCASKERAALDG